MFDACFWWCFFCVLVLFFLVCGVVLFGGLLVVFVGWGMAGVGFGWLLLFWDLFVCFWGVVGLFGFLCCLFFVCVVGFVSCDRYSVLLPGA